MSGSTEALRSAPRYQKIKEEIAGRIARAELEPGVALPTRDELASEFQTARATVNRALQELAREGLVTAGSGRRTLVAEPPQRPVTSVTVAWNWPEEQTRAGSDYLDLLFGGVRRACMAFPLEVNYRSSIVSFAEAARESGGQGLLAIRPDYSDVGELERLHRAGVPVVAAPGVLESDTVPAVSADNAMGIRQAVTHLIELGHRDIAFVSLTATLPDHFERLQAFLTAMSDHGLPLLPGRLFLMHEMRTAAFSTRIAEWLNPDDLPTAILVGDFLMTLATLRRLNEIGARVPQDVSLISFDDPAAAAHTLPALTVVRQDIPEIGSRAIESLVALIRRQPVPLVQRIPTELIVRESTMQPRSSRQNH